ncbi:exosortase family protein XrtG [Ligilactobacillus saerimneri]|uniref:Exosortase n=1 Tax=Ligilactobacillus saerimneri 30a TaxID=1227363 RepID=M5J5C4_9LACO|nr:exosortase family protein XrtG [Ligilactobacillus saerimneri]EKW99326.1 hypothetical protein D271_02834 [Ligilactobacillus saerimneri 30a]KRL74790.1 hypothetical protein FC54_GL000617 [Ligilactobacillus saerimneri DSM 16049]MBU5309819.1 exosortase family protein XrtG [Ligilactobacillus saerimneri]
MITGTIILGTIIWLYALSVLHRAHLDAIHFWVGSVGLFIILAFVCRAYFVWLLSALVTEVTGWWGHLTGIYTSSYLHNLISIKNNHGLVLLFVDYECSGIIETLAYLSLLWFYPFYRGMAKVKWTVLGVGWIFIANVFRLSLIATILYYTGNGSFFWVHTVFGRILFYVMVIGLYYHVFTRSQLGQAGHQQFQMREETNG